MPAYEFSHCVITAEAPALVDRAAGHVWFPHLFAIDGVLLCEVATSDDKPQGDWPAVLYVSDDGGRHWRRAATLRTAGPAAVPRGPNRLLLMPYENWPIAPGTTRSTRADGTIVSRNARGEIAVEPVEVTFRDFPRDLADYHEGELALFTNGNIVPLRDGRLFTTLYGKFAVEEKYDLFAAASDNGGLSWRFLSIVATGSAVPDAPEGADESNTVRLADGRLLCVFRVGSWRDFHKSYSPDDGATWTSPERIPGAWSVEPRLVRLANGLIVLTGGREGLFVWICADGEGRTWERFNVAGHHNATISDPDLAFTERFVAATEVGQPQESTAYMGLVAVGPDEVLVAYDRMSNGWEGTPGPRGDMDAVFTIRVRITRK